MNWLFKPLLLLIAKSTENELARQVEYPPGCFSGIANLKYVRHETFDATLQEAGIEVVKIPYRSPNMNAYIERFVQSIQQECLDKFIAFGREHFDHLIGEYTSYYHHERPHQAKDNKPLISPTAAAATSGTLHVRERLGGVLKHSWREAA